jgi:hypothetical protein
LKPREHFPLGTSHVDGSRTLGFSVDTVNIF